MLTSPTTFTRYFIAQFLKLCAITASILLFIFSVIDILNFVQLSHKYPHVHFEIFAKLFLYHQIYLITEAIPFILIIATIAFLIKHHQAHHFTIVRHCGKSLTRIMMPILNVIFLLGVLETLLLNPFYTITQKRYDALSRHYFAEPSQITSIIQSGIWFSLKSNSNHHTLMNAQSIDNDQNLTGITVFMLNNNQIYNIMTAKTARLYNASYILHDVMIYQENGTITHQDSYTLDALPRAKDVNLISLKPLTSPFHSIYEIPQYIKSLSILGISTNAAQTSFTYLILRPLYYLLFILGPFVFLINLKPRQPYKIRAIYAVTTGFSLYIILKLALNFATAGQWNPILAVLGTYIILAVTVIYMIIVASDT